MARSIRSTRHSQSSSVWASSNFVSACCWSSNARHVLLNTSCGCCSTLWRRPDDSVAIVAASTVAANCDRVWCALPNISTSARAARTATGSSSCRCVGAALVSAFASIARSRFKTRSMNGASCDESGGRVASWESAATDSARATFSPLALSSSRRDRRFDLRSFQAMFFESIT